MTKFPDWIVPMAATLTQERFTGPEWVFERKFDGIRLLAFKQGGDVRLFSRNRFASTSPAIAGGGGVARTTSSWTARCRRLAERYDVFDVAVAGTGICAALPSTSAASGCDGCRCGRRCARWRP